MEYVKYYNIDTLVNLSTIKFSASQDDTSYITYSNPTSQVVNFHFNNYSETKQTNVDVESDTDNE